MIRSDTNQMDKNKKRTKIHYIKIILSNILLLLIVFFVIDYSAYSIRIFQDSLHNRYLLSLNRFFSVFSENTIEMRLHGKGNYFRPPSIIKNAKRPIILFGCSFVYGDSLKDNETFSAQLSKYTNRSVYNYGVSSGSPKETLYILRYYKELQNIKNPEYIIFTYVTDHKRRLYMYSWTDCELDMPRFKKINNSLVYDSKKRNILYESRFAILLSEYIAEKKSLLPETNDLLNLYFTEIQKEIKRLYPNTKFAILVYFEDGTENWNYLLKQGIDVINVQSLIDKDIKDIHSVEYIIAPDDIHPNAKAWQVIIPPLVKNLHL